MNELLLRAFADGSTLVATPAALLVQLPPNPDRVGTLGDIGEPSLRLELEQLDEQGVLERTHQGWQADWEDLAAACDDGFGGFLGELGDPNPYLLHMDGSTALAAAGFQFVVTWRSGQRTVVVEQFGMFLRVPETERIVRLDTHVLRLLLAAYAFNSLDAEQRGPEQMFESLASVHDFAMDAPVHLADVLTGSRVVIPDHIGLEVRVEADDSITFLPVCDGVEKDGLQKAFVLTRGRKSVYSIREADGSFTRVLFGARQLEVLDRMRTVRHRSGPDATQLRDEPGQLFEGLLDVLDLTFWERVVGIGELSPVSTPKNSDSAGGFLDGPDEEAHSTTEDANPAQPAAPEPERKDRSEPVRSGTFLIVSTNEEDAWAPRANGSTLDPTVDTDAVVNPLPAAFRGTLKAHQLEAVRWLARSRGLSRRGVLLADDMGLGKTLQVLVHLASLIESGRLGERRDPATGQVQWRPILLVVPLILLENETWQADMRSFFDAKGDIFSPIHVLHGKGIDAARAQAGRDIVIGTAALRADFLMSHRVVITNYETIVNYQISLAQLQDGKPMWSAIVTDEAQEYKDPKTRLSHALKALDADFLIASTGTPVENRLLDLWNIVDTVQPSLLGTARDFSARYERAAGDDDQREGMSALRSTLRYEEPDAWVLRRTKDQVLRGDLPEKLVVRLACPMSTTEVDNHEGMLAGLREMSGKGQHLKVLQGLVRLYQHPLGEAIRTASVAELVASSSKLQAVLAQLTEIQKAGEKVLIFARLRDIQVMLANVIEAELGVHVPIINGSTSSGKGRSGSSMGTARAKQSRQGILKEFQESPGFGVCVLSPFVAGTGLTITAANHVIHYGRWWNPAVEAQATDRAYRIGQERTVTVYLPIATDPSGRLKRSFDELLDELLSRKSSLTEFLTPTSREDECGEELVDELLQHQNADATPALTLKGVRAMGPLAFEALLAELFARDGYEVCLTPQSGDGGADLVGRRNGELLLVQAKFSQADALIEESALQDLIAACDHFGNIGQHQSVRLVLATNARFSRAVLDVAERDGFVLLGPDRLSGWLESASINHGDVINRETTRHRSLSQTEQWLRGVH